jgi:ABC-2 type transport system ATP-binding protein
MAPRTDDNVIQTVKLTKVFRDFWRRPKVRAVDQLDLEIRRGEVFGLLGPNGSGKSTTIKLLLGLLFPTSGTIRILGRTPRDVRVKARIGFLPEETYLYPYLNAEETLEFFGRLSRIPRAERHRRVEALVDMVGLAPARRRPLREYSKGMARRIGLAQALINDPELLLLDEPTTGLDPIGAREVKDLILELKKRGKTVLLCSHLLAHAEDVCDRIGIMYAGRLWVVGDVRDLLARHQLTQITVPDLSPDAAEQLKAQIQQTTGAGSVEIGHPVERLENFFLRVIREAREAHPETAGAAAGRFDASLFREVPKPQQVIERLTRQEGHRESFLSAEKTPDVFSEPAEAPPPAAPEPAPDVLQRLTAVQPQPTPAATQSQRPAVADAEAARAQQREIIDRLVQKPKQDTESR